MPQRRSPLAMIGAGLVVVLGGVGFTMFKSTLLGPGKGKATYSSLSIDKDKADGDKMISSVNNLATKWRSDAFWWSVNYQAVHADGTVDVSKGAEVEYVSPSRVQGLTKKLREDAIKKFQFGSSVVDYSKSWYAINQWKGVEKPDSPGCSIKELTKKLADKGLKGDKTVRITFDPQFDWGEIQTWHVIGKDPEIDAHYSMKDCSQVSSVAAGGHSSDEDE